MKKIGQMRLALICGNTIAFNGADGVWIRDAATGGNRVLRNAIYSNGGLGIDLELNGVTANDGPGDADAGPNGLQNYPVLYAPGAADAAGFGEGQRYLGFANVNTDAAGNATVTSITIAAAVAAGEVISAPATHTTP